MTDSYKTGLVQYKLRPIGLYRWRDGLTVYLATDEAGWFYAKRSGENTYVPLERLPDE